MHHFIKVNFYIQNPRRIRGQNQWPKLRRPPGMIYYIGYHTRREDDKSPHSLNSEEQQMMYGARLSNVMAICRKTVFFTTKSPQLLSVHITGIQRFFCDIGSFSTNNNGRGKVRVGTGWGLGGWVGGGGQGEWVGTGCEVYGAELSMEQHLTVEILAYIIHTISRTQSYLGFGHRGWLSLHTPWPFRLKGYCRCLGPSDRPSVNTIWSTR